MEEYIMGFDATFFGFTDEQDLACELAMHFPLKQLSGIGLAIIWLSFRTLAVWVSIVFMKVRLLKT